MTNLGLLYAGVKLVQVRRSDGSITKNFRGRSRCALWEFYRKRVIWTSLGVNEINAAKLPKSLCDGYSISETMLMIKGHLQGQNPIRVK